MTLFSEQEVKQYGLLRLCLLTLGIKVEEGDWVHCYALLVHPTEPVLHTTHSGDVPNVMRVSLLPGSERFHIVYGPPGNAGLGGHDLRSTVQAILLFVQEGGS